MFLLLSCGGSLCAAQQTAKEGPERPAREMIGTSLAPNTCKTATVDNDNDARICKGVDDYSLLITNDDKKPRIFLVTPDGARHPIYYWDTTDPAFHGVDSSVLWLVVNEPQKTIAIDLKLKVDASEDRKYADYDVIVRVSPLPVCVVASLPTSPRASSDKIVMATSPADRPCLELGDLQKKEAARPNR